MAGRKRITNELYNGIDNAVKTLGKKHFAGESDIIAARNISDFDTPIWGFYGWTRGARLIAPNQQPYLLVRDSPLLDVKVAQQAVAATRSGKLFFPGKKVYGAHMKQAEEDKDKLPERRRVMILDGDRRDTFYIEDGDDEVLRFEAKGKKAAQAYYKLLGEGGITQEIRFVLPYRWGIDTNPNIKEPYLEQSWFDNSTDSSDFNGVDGGFGSHIWALGVFPIRTQTTG